MLRFGIVEKTEEMRGRGVSLSEAIWSFHFTDGMRMS
jgi:hypothetical protein